MNCKRLLRLSLLATMTVPLLGCGSVSQPVTGFGRPGGSTTNPSTRLDFVVGSPLSSTTTSAQVTAVKSFVLVNISGSANPAVDFSMRPVAFVYQAPSFSPYPGTSFATSPVAVPAKGVVPGTVDTAQTYQNLVPMNAAAGDYVEFTKYAPVTIPNPLVPPVIIAPPAPSTALVPTQTFYYFPPSPYPGGQASSPAMKSYFMGQFDSGSYVYTPPAQILPDANGLPLDTFALVATPEDPAIASQVAPLLIHLNLSVTVTPATATITANPSSTQTPYTQLFTAVVPGDGVNGDGLTHGKVEWHCYKGDANGNLVSTSGTSLDPQGTPLDVHGNPISGATKQMAVEATDPNSGNRLLIDKNTGLFTAPVATPSAGVTTATYVIKAFSLTQTDKFGTAVIRVSQQSTTIGFN